MIRFASGVMHGELKGLLNKADRAWIAIAFWGEGAIKNLGLKPRRASIERIVCNLESGACNPDVIEGLVKLGYDVRTHKKLHAKLIWTDQEVFVGSSNASSNGLGFEGQEVLANIEANAIVSDEPEFSVSCREKADRIWRDAHPITRSDLLKASAAWAARRSNRHKMLVKPRSAARSLVDKMRRDPEYFRDLRAWIWIYDAEDLTASAAKKFASERSEFNTFIDAYEDVSPQPKGGDVVFDFSRENGKFHWGQAWQFIENPRRRWRGGYIDLCTRISDFEGFSFRGLNNELQRYVVERGLRRIATGKLNKDVSLHELAKSLAA
jgi:hypothetical protein